MATTPPPGPTDQIGQIMPLLNFLAGLGGQKQNVTTSGSGTATTSIDPAALAGLQAVLGQQLTQITPEGLSAIVGALFREGNKQVPALATQFGQAAGARTDNNSVLAYQNGLLQQNLTDLALKALMQAQQQASQTATQVANTGPKTTTESRTSNQSGTTGQPRSALAALLPFALSNSSLQGFGKSLFDKLSGGSIGMDVGSSASGSQLPNFSGTNVGELTNLRAIDNVMTTTGGSINDAALSAGLLDSLSGTMSFDPINFTDLSSLGSFDLSSIGDLSGVSDLLAYANGGLVKKSLLTAKAKGYADGGRVTSATDGMTADPGVYAVEGTVDPLGPTTTPTTTAVTPTPTTVDPTAPTKLMGTMLDKSVVDAFTGQSGGQLRTFTDPTGRMFRSDLDPSVASGGGENQFDNGNPNLAWNRITQIGANGNQFGYYGQGGPLFLPQYKDTGEFATLNTNLPQNNSALGSFVGMLLTAAGLATGNPAAFAISTGMKTALPGVLGDLTGANNTYDKIGQIANQLMYGAGGAPNNSGIGQTQQFAGGGEVAGPGTGTSDSVPAMLSDGEYVISADTVAALGPEFFDALQAMFHKPVARTA